MSEAPRIAFLLQRDGIAATHEWVRRTIKIYRRAVLDKGDTNRQPHFASTRDFRARFIRSYCEFKAWLKEQPNEA